MEGLAIWTEIQKVGEYYYFVLAEQNGICRLKEGDSSASLIYFEEKKKTYNKLLFYGIEVVEHYVIFIPSREDKIIIYDTFDEKISQYFIDNDLLQNSNTKFWGHFQYNNSVYMLGYSYPIILKMDVTSKKISYIRCFEDEFLPNQSNVGWFGENVAIVGDSAIIPVAMKPILLKLNLKTNEVQQLKCNTSNAGFGGITKDKDNLWIIGRGNGKKNLIRFNLSEQISEEIQVPHEENAFDPFYAPICIENILYLFPMKGERKVRSYDFIERQWKDEKCLNNVFQEKRKSSITWKMTKPYRIGNQVLFWNIKDGQLYHFSPKTGEYCTQKVKFQYSQEYIKKIMVEKIERNKVLCETKDFGLKEFVNTIIQV